MLLRVIFLVALVCANLTDSETIKAQNSIIALRHTVEIDGRIEDAWQQVEAVDVNKTVKKLTTIDNENCPTARIKCLWDDEFLYILADVKDSVISTKNGNPWAQDSIEIFIDEDCSRSNAYDKHDLQFRVSAIGDVTVGGNAKKNQIKAKVVPMTGGYRVESAICLSPKFLGPGNKIGFEFQVNNDPGTGQRESITKWNHPSNDSWRDTSNFGTIVTKGKRISQSESLSKTETNARPVSFLNSRNMRSFAAVPDWARDAIFYQIFPERFRNGDRSNDPTRDSLEFPDIVPASWEITPWTAEWYRRADWEIEMGQSFYDDGVFHRRLGGDLQGVIDKLDYLHELGINAIYFNPVFYARSLHKYDGNSFHHVDPHFGPDPDGDFEIIKSETADPATWKWTSADKLFLRLLKKAKAKKIRVIIDGVFNHTGRGFFAFEDVVKNQAKSPYASWYMIDEFDDPKTRQNEFKYKGWWGVDTLPEFADNQSGDNLHPEPKAYIMSATARWMDPNGDGDPNDGIDGWRLDVANEVPNKFWREWNSHVRSINPNAYTVAEIWDNASSYLIDCGFSATMNYHGFAFPIKGFLIDGRLNASEFGKIIDLRMREHNPSIRYALQNLLDSHDTDRVSSMIVNAQHRREYLNAERFDYDVGERASPRYAKKYDVSAPGDRDKRILKLAALFQMTFVGAPMIYYGTECGMDGADDPDDRMPMVWEDLKFEPRTMGPNGQLDKKFPIKFDRKVFGYYQKLIRLRKNHRVLREGEFSVLHSDDASGVFVYLRELGSEKMIVAINRGEKDVRIGAKEVSVNLDRLEKVFDSASVEDGLAKGKLQKTQDSLTVSIPRVSGQVWRVK